MKHNCPQCNIEVNKKAICCSRSCAQLLRWSNEEYRNHMRKVHYPLLENIEKLVTFIKSEKGRKLVSERFKGVPSWNKGKKCPENSGENHYLWKKDRSTLIKRQKRNDSAYGDWRINVYKRDNYKCKILNKDCNGRIEAHHILGWKSHPELRYEINNGITLCRFHHPRKRIEEVNLSPYFQKMVMNIK